MEHFLKLLFLLYKLQRKKHDKLAIGDELKMLYFSMVGWSGEWNYWNLLEIGDF